MSWACMWFRGLCLNGGEISAKEVHSHQNLACYIFEASGVVVWVQRGWVFGWLIGFCLPLARYRMVSSGAHRIGTQQALRCIGHIVM